MNEIAWHNFQNWQVRYPHPLTLSLHLKQLNFDKECLCKLAIQTASPAVPSLCNGYSKLQHSGQRKLEANTRAITTRDLEIWWQQTDRLSYAFTLPNPWGGVPYSSAKTHSPLLPHIPSPCTNASLSQSCTTCRLRTDFQQTLRCLSRQTLVEPWKWQKERCGDLGKLEKRKSSQGCRCQTINRAKTSRTSNRSLLVTLHWRSFGYVRICPEIYGVTIDSTQQTFVQSEYFNTHT